MATYTNSGGLTKPATGEFSGTWGTITNTNFDILDRLVNGVASIPLTSTPYALATSDGALSVGQYLLINFTGSLGGTVTVNVTPQDATKIYFIRNSSNSSLVISQGSGSTVTIASGYSKLVYTDGAGSTASVFDFTSVLSMSGVQITGGTITGITDLAVADGGTGASTLTGYVKGTGTAALSGVASIPSTDITGLGTMSTQAASAVAITGGTLTGVSSSNITITGGSITGITDLAVADGGTGASTGAGALSNFGLTATVTELNYTSGVTSAIQTQLNTKAPLASPALTGTPTAPTATAGTNTTQVATTEFVLANGTKMQKIAGIAMAGSSVVEFTGIPSTANTVILSLNGASMNAQGHFLVQLGTSSGYVASTGVSLSALGSTTSVVSNGTGQLIWVDSAGYNSVGKMTFTKSENTAGAETWTQNSAFYQASNNIQYGSGVSSSGVGSGSLDRLKIFTTTGSFDAGVAYLWWEA
jgi:hypothetical protein